MNSRSHSGQAMLFVTFLGGLIACDVNEGDGAALSFVLALCCIASFFAGYIDRSLNEVEE